MHFSAQNAANIAVAPPGPAGELKPCPKPFSRGRRKDGNKGREGEGEGRERRKGRTGREMRQGKGSCLPTKVFESRRLWRYRVLGTKKSFQSGAQRKLPYGNALIFIPHTMPRLIAPPTFCPAAVICRAVDKLCFLMWFIHSRVVFTIRNCAVRTAARRTLASRLSSSTVWTRGCNIYCVTYKPSLIRYCNDMHRRYLNV